MRRFTVIRANRIWLRNFVLSILLTGVSTTIFSYCGARVMLLLDLKLEYTKYISVFVCLLTALIVSVFCSRGFKNRGVIAALISCVPLVCVSLFNLIFKDNTLYIFLIKLATIIVVSCVIGRVSTKSSTKFKVK